MARTWNSKVIQVIAINLLIPAMLMAVDTRDRVDSQVIFQLNLRGELQPGETARRSEGIGTPEVEFLQSEIVQNELDVLDNQQHGLRAIFDRHEKSARALMDELLNRKLANPQAESHELRQRMKALEQETLAEIDRVLLPFQSERLNQIRFRCDVRQQGLRTLLCTGELSSRLKLDETTRSRISERSRAKAIELLAMAKERRRSVLDELQSTLTEDQRRQLRQELGDYYYGTNSNLEVLIWQLGYKADPAAPSGEYAGFRANVWFRVAVDGTLQPAPRPVRRQKPLAEVVLPQLFLNEALVNGLGLSDDQMFLMELLKDECKKALTTFDRDLQWASEEGLTTNRQEHARLLATLAKQKGDALAQLDADFHRVFLPEQLARLKKLDGQLDIMRRGYVAALTDGTMGKILRISAAQQSAMETRARELRSALIRDTAKWQAESDAVLLAELPVEARRTLEAQLGPPLSKTPGNITLLLLDLAR